MGQTLTHGVYLPDEGERNCYSGLASNWSILDGAVGTVAEHTTQIAGKASASHTHGNITNDGKVGTTANKPLITGTGGVVQAGSFGNQANTFCEGNDSRLSDARTPVAHTHGKADVTDLFNSANTWTGDNTYSTSIIYQSNHALGNLPQSADTQTALKINDSAGTNYLAQIATYQTTDATGLRITIRDKFDSNGFSPSGNNRNKYFNFLQNAANQGYIRWDGYVNNSIIPLANNTYDLGSSSYQWNNLYAKKVNTQSVNGINPGALSLPDYDSADPINFSQWDTTGAVGLNYYTPTVNGWLNISIFDRATNSIFVYRSGKERVGVFGNGSMAADGRIALLMPVKANATYTIIIKASANSDIYAANFFPCLGNV